MTTGPEPRIRTDAGLWTRRAQRVRASRRRRGRHEPVEDRQRVERPGRALGVVLDRLDRLLAVAQALDRAVVEVDLADPEARRRRQRLADDLDLVVLGGHLDQPHLEVADRVVRAVVPEPEAGRVRARGPPHDLVAEADAEQRPAVVDDRAAPARPGPSSRAGSPGPGDRITPSMSGGQRRPRTRSCAAGPGRARRGGASTRTMFVLQPEVDDRDPRAAVRRRARWSVDRRRRDLADEVLVLPARHGPGARRRPRRGSVSPGAVTMPRRQPLARRWRASARVSTPAMAGIDGVAQQRGELAGIVEDRGRRVGDDERRAATAGSTGRRRASRP